MRLRGTYMDVSRRAFLKAVSTGSVMVVAGWHAGRCISEEVDDAVVELIERPTDWVLDVVRADGRRHTSVPISPETASRAWLYLEHSGEGQLVELDLSPDHDLTVSFHVSGVTVSPQGYA